MLARARVLFALSVLAFPAIASAHHGPATSGAAIGTQSADTLSQGKLAFELRVDDTTFRGVPAMDLGGLAMRAGHFELIDRSLLTTLSVSYGILSRLQATAALGYYAAAGTRIAHAGIYEPSLATANVDGLGDLWFTLKYRVLELGPGRLALYAGAKFPTGRADVLDSSGDIVDPGTTAGTGSFDFLFGLAHTLRLTARADLFASFQYTLQGAHAGYDLGDRIDAGIALAYRLREDPAALPRVFLLAELDVRHLFQTTLESGTGVLHARGAAPSEDPHSRNTGGTTVFLSPGLRVDLTRTVGFMASFQVPVLERLNGDQVQTAYKAVLSLLLWTP